MKNIALLMIAVLALVFTSCVEEEYLTPVADFEVFEVNVDETSGEDILSTINLVSGEAGMVTLTVYENQQLEFQNTGVGTHFSIWNGVGNANYFSDNDMALGKDFPIETPYRYKYSETGEYKLIVWSTSLNANDAQEFSRDSKICMVKVNEDPASE